MAAPGISVVIPTFRRTRLLHKCLLALHAQSYPGCCFEVIVVSDGPDPETEALVQSFIRENGTIRLEYCHLPAKAGPAAARNYGWRRAGGELIAFTDDDCIPDPDWLAAFWRAYRFHDQQLIAFTGRVIVPVPERPTDYEKNVAHLSTAEFITANCACSRQVMELTGGFDEEFPAAWREDSDLHFRLLAEQIPIEYIAEAVVCHPVRAAHWGVSISDQRKSMFNALLYRKHPSFYRSRIARGPVWNYYAIIAATFGAIAGFAMGMPLLGGVALLVWAIAVVSFIARRLKGTCVSFSHCLEMIVTSLFIPYLSVYWTIRGALRYKVFFL